MNRFIDLTKFHLGEPSFQNGSTGPEPEPTEPTFTGLMFRLRFSDMYDGPDLVAINVNSITDISGNKVKFYFNNTFGGIQNGGLIFTGNGEYLDCDSELPIVQEMTVVTIFNPVGGKIYEAEKIYNSSQSLQQSNIASLEIRPVTKQFICGSAGVAATLTQDSFDQMMVLCQSYTSDAGLTLKDLITGNTITSTSNKSINSYPISWRIGGVGDGINTINAKMVLYEQLLFDHVLTEKEMNDMKAYVKFKYQLETV